MFLKNLCVLVLLTKVASAFEWLMLSLFSSKQENQSKIYVIQHLIMLCFGHVVFSYDLWVALAIASFYMIVH